MIDITKIQTFVIPPAILELQKENGDLLTENNKLKRWIYSAGIGLASGLLIYLIFFKKDENEKRPK